MPGDSLPAQRSPTSLQHTINGWAQMLLRPNADYYLEQLSETGWPKALLGISVFSLLASLYLYSLGRIPALAGSAALNILLAAVLIVAAFFLVNLLIFLSMKLFSGAGSLVDQILLLSLLVTPLGIGLLLILFAARALGLDFGEVVNPLSLTGLLGALLLLFGLYSIFLLLLALSTVHMVKASKAFYAIGILVLIAVGVRVALMFTGGEETLITRMWTFLVQQWNGGYLQEAMLGHFWLVFFSVIVAVFIGVLIGVLITFPPSRPSLSHLGFAIPLVVFFLIWAAASGLFGVETAEQIESTVRAWDRSLRGTEGFFGELFNIIGAIVRKPAAIGLIGIIIIAIIYVLLLSGEKASELTLYIAGIFLTIPSIALFGVLVRPLGVGAFNAAVALILYAQLPILRNTYTGIREVQPEVVEAGRGMGMTEMQLLMDVKLPLAVPVIMTGLRVSTVMLIGIAAIAAYIGNNTLGDYIFAGIQRAQEVRYITGAIVVAVLALAVDYLLDWVQERMTPVGLKERRKNA